MSWRSSILVVFVTCVITAQAQPLLSAEWVTCDKWEIKLVSTSGLLFYEILPSGSPVPDPISTINSVYTEFTAEPYDPSLAWDVFYKPLSSGPTGEVFSIVLPPCTGTSGSPGGVEKDPHMTTFDGVRYNYQGVCTYILTQDCRDINNPSFQITAEFRGKYSELRSKPLTRIDAVNVNVGGIQLLRILRNNNFLIKGELFTNSSAVIGNNDGHVELVGEHLYAKLNNPDISLIWTKETHGINIALNDQDMRDNVCGLLGNNNGDPDDDLMKPDGDIMTKDDIYEFGNSWEIPGSCQ